MWWVFTVSGARLSGDVRALDGSDSACMVGQLSGDQMKSTAVILVLCGSYVTPEPQESPI